MTSLTAQNGDQYQIDNLKSMDTDAFKNLLKDVGGENQTSKKADALALIEETMGDYMNFNLYKNILKHDVNYLKSFIQVVEDLQTQISKDIKLPKMSLIPYLGKRSAKSAFKSQHKT